MEVSPSRILLHPLFLLKQKTMYRNKNLESLENEIWIDAIGYDGMYSVSNFGRVKSERRLVNNGSGGRWVKERILSQAKLKKWNRLQVVLSVNSICKTHLVSVLVYDSFTYNYEDISKDNPVVQHINKNPLDNRLSNLERTTWSSSHSQNFKMGKLPHIEKNKEIVRLAVIKANTGRKHTKEAREKKAQKDRKISEEQMIEIKKLLKTGMYQKDIAKKYNVSNGVINKINLGKYVLNLLKV